MRVRDKPENDLHEGVRVWRAKTGVYPVFENKFKIGASAESLNTIAEMENFSVSIDGNVEEWSPMEQEGWLKRMVTGKALTISPVRQTLHRRPGQRFCRGQCLGNRFRLRSAFRMGVPQRCEAGFPLCAERDQSGRRREPQCCGIGI